MTNNANRIISLRVLALVNAGKSPLDALREVCGTETVDQMIDTLYNELRKAQEVR